jgi:hypothetical protein
MSLSSHPSSGTPVQGTLAGTEDTLQVQIASGGGLLVNSPLLEDCVQDIRCLLAACVLHLKGITDCAFGVELAHDVLSGD